MDWQEQQKLEIEALQRREAQDKAIAAKVMPKPASKPALPAVALPDTEDVRELARAATPQAIRALVEIVQDDDASASSRIAAASALLDRAHGKPHQSMDLLAAVKHSFEPLVIKLADDTKVIEG